MVLQRAGTLSVCCMNKLYGGDVTVVLKDSQYLCLTVSLVIHPCLLLGIHRNDSHRCAHALICTHACIIMSL